MSQRHGVGALTQTHHTSWGGVSPQATFTTCMLPHCTEHGPGHHTDLQTRVEKGAGRPQMAGLADGPRGRGPGKERGR